MKGKIKAVTKDIKERNGELQTGFLISDKWYNVIGEKEALQTLRNTILKKGNIIEFKNDMGKATEIKLIEEGKIDHKENKEDMINFGELLSKAHEKAGEKNLNICTKLISHDTEKNIVIFKARVIETDKDGAKSVFEAHGDASPETVGIMIRQHYIRMAETRAIARALRWYTNNATTASVEVS